MPSEEALAEASRVMAECVAKNKGENVAYYLAEAIDKARREERDACIAIAEQRWTNSGQMVAAAILRERS